MDKQKRLLWPWIVGAMFGLFVLYPLSAGPAEWLLVRMRWPIWWLNTTEFIYAPLFFVLDKCPEWLAESFVDYVIWWRELAAPTP
jgi:hypothetical protein